MPKGKGKGRENDDRRNDRNDQNDQNDNIFDSARELIKRSGIDIGDNVVVVIQGGPVIIGRLVAAFDGVIRVLTTSVTDGIPVGTLLTINIEHIAAIGRSPI
jgi:hypothetical protein